MRKLILTLTTLLTVAAPIAVVATATPADAARHLERACMSHAEFLAIHRPMTLRQVRRIADIPGRMTHGPFKPSPRYGLPYRWSNWEFRACGTFGGQAQTVYAGLWEHGGGWRLHDKFGPWHRPGFGD